jgi:hypothetical protein
LAQCIDDLSIEFARRSLFVEIQRLIYTMTLQYREELQRMIRAELLRCESCGMNLMKRKVKGGKMALVLHLGKDRLVLTKEVSVSAKSGNAPSLILTAPGQRG